MFKRLSPIALIACVTLSSCVSLSTRTQNTEHTKPTVVSVETITMPVAFRFHTVKLVNGSLYVTGNELPNTIPCSGRYGQYVWKINPNTGVSTQKWRMPYNNAHADTVVLGEKLVTLGGMVGNSNNICSSGAWGQTFDTANPQTSLTTVFNPGVHDPEVIPLSEGNVLEVGGWEDSTSSKQVKIVSPVLQVLKSFTLNTGRSYRTVHQLTNGAILVIGGLFYNGKTPINLASIELLDPGAGTAKLASYSLNKARRYHSSVLINDLVYVFGGTSINEMGRPPAIDSIEKIDPAHQTVSIAGQLRYPREHMQTVKLTKGNRTYVGIFGGQSDVKTPVPEAEIFDPTNGTTHILSGVSWGLVDHDRVSVCNDNILYLVGGENIATGKGVNTITKITFDNETTCRKDG